MFILISFVTEEYFIFEGVGNEVIISCVTVLTSLAVLFYCVWKNADWRFYDDEVPDNLEGDNRTLEPPRASETCSICLNGLILTLETNCGHRFCGQCLLTLYHRNVNGPLRIIVCPLCRTQVNLLFTCYTNSERNAEEGSELFLQRGRVNSFCRMYNRVYSAVERSKICNQSLENVTRLVETSRFEKRLSSKANLLVGSFTAPIAILSYLIIFIWVSMIREIPILMRHYFDDLMNGDQMPGITYLNLRMCLLFIFSTVYLILPTDILPETVFGIIGWLDDIFIIITIILYMCSVYRYYVANNGGEE